MGFVSFAGNEPLVIARGGFSGIFPDSSYNAYAFAIPISLPSVALWCDVQLTNEGAGICAPDLRLENSSNIASVFQNRSSTYLVNGVSMQGWFSIDFTLDDLANVYCKFKLHLLYKYLGFLQFLVYPCFFL